MKERKISLDDEIIISCAFRYCLGRMTYVVSTMCNKLKEVYDVLPDNTKERISKEIQEYQDKYGLAGMEFDNDEWNKIKWLYSKKYHLPIKANKYNTDEWVDVIAVKGENGIYYSIPNMNEYHTVKEVNIYTKCNYKIM